MDKGTYSPNPYSTYIPLSSLPMSSGEGSAALSGNSKGSTLQFPSASPGISQENKPSKMAPPTPGSNSPRNKSGWIKSDEMRSFGAYTVNVEPIDSKSPIPFADRTNVSQSSNTLELPKQDFKATTPTRIHLSLTPTQDYLSPSLTPQSPKHINENSIPNFNDGQQKISNLSRKVFVEKSIDQKARVQNDSFSSLLGFSHKSKEHTEAKISAIEKEISTLEKYINQPDKAEELRTLRTYLNKLKHDRGVLKGFLNSKSTFKPTVN